MKRNNILLIVILAILAFALWVIIPLGSSRFGREGIQLGLDLQGGTRLVYQADLSGVASADKKDVMDGVIAVIANRINPLGVTEPVIEKRGESQIVVELPNLSVTDKQKERIGRIALLEFGELVEEGDPDIRWENSLGKWKPATATIDGQVKELTSSYFKDNTYVVNNDLYGILLVFEWTEEGSKISEVVTSRLAGNPTTDADDKPLGIFEGDEALLGDDGLPIAPIVRSTITDSGQIEGLSLKEATELSKQLNAGRLPVPLEKLYELSVDPALGGNFIKLAIEAGIIGLLLVMAFMMAYYRVSGVLASLALLFYGVLTMAIFKLIPVTLTLAGLGGFIVSIGMAVDANVLIFERMKEEFRAGKMLGASIDSGFHRAWLAIRDSNLTTFIACGILYWVGSMVVAGAPVKGFALTLFIGVAVSMFTAITVTQTLLKLFIGTGLHDKPSYFTPFLGRK